MKPSLSSRLRKVIEIEAPSEEQDEAGGFVIKWHNIATVFAEIKPIVGYRNKGGEIFSAMQLMNNDTYLFTVRYMPELNHKMRIKYRNRIFRITRIVNEQEGDYVQQVIAEEEVAR